MSHLLALAAAAALCGPGAGGPDDIEDVPAAHALAIDSERPYRVGDLPIDVTIEVVDQSGERADGVCGAIEVRGLERDGEAVTKSPALVGGAVTIEGVVPADRVEVRANTAAGDVLEAQWTPDVRRLPGALSILPPLFAVGLAILLRQALIALLAGLWLGAFFVYDYAPVAAFLRVADTHIPQAVANPSHAAILIFSVALGGMVGVISRSGGTRALVEALARRARSRRAGMVSTAAAGMFVFFDDYANCLLVGNTARPYTDELRISREKLSYLVDSTAAPLATVALISTWIGFQLGIFGDVLPDEGSPYELFLQLLPYSFYSFFALAFVALIAITGRDFGPMRRAEARAHDRGELVRPGGRPLMDRELSDMQPAEGARTHALTAAVPVGAVIAFVALGLYLSGARAEDSGASLREIIAAADPYAVLLWASFGGSAVAIAIAAALRTISVKDAIDAWIGGAKAMTIAVLILILAWAIGAMCMDYLDTGDWLISQVSPSAPLLPVITFFIAAAIAFSTGSSFSTMAIVIPIAAPMAWALTGDASGVTEAAADPIRFATLASVLSGAVFGDHCSPISDTTIMASMSSAADHIDHVRTQLPYASVCAAAAALVGFIPAGFGLSPWISLPLGVALLAGTILLMGRKPSEVPSAEPEER